MSNLGFLRSVKRTDSLGPASVGAFVASDGSWSRKGQIVEVTRVVCPKGTKAKIRSGCSPVAYVPVTTYYRVRVKFLGSFWADGRVRYATRESYSTKSFWRMPDGRLIQESGWVPVVPTL